MKLHDTAREKPEVFGRLGAALRLVEAAATGCNQRIAAQHQRIAVPCRHRQCFGFGQGQHDRVESFSCQCGLQCAFIKLRRNAGEIHPRSNQHRFARLTL